MTLLTNVTAWGTVTDSYIVASKLIKSSGTVPLSHFPTSCKFFLETGFCECEQLYLSASGALAQNQGAVLGKYLRGNGFRNGHSFYWKTTQTKTFYIEFLLDGKLQFLMSYDFTNALSLRF